MKNSLRWGWTSDGDRILLWRFDHVDGIFNFIFERTVEFGEWVELELIAEKESFFGYRLYPYFGGKLAAPHEMQIDIDWF